MKTVILIKDVNEGLVNFDKICRIGINYYDVRVRIAAEMDNQKEIALFEGKSEEAEEWFLWFEEQFEAAQEFQIAVLDYPDKAMKISDFARIDYQEFFGSKTKAPETKVPETGKPDWFKNIF